MLCADQAAMAEAAGGAWHGLLVARLLLEQPTRMRWELAEALPAGISGLAEVTKLRPPYTTTTARQNEPARVQLTGDQTTPSGLTLL